MKKQLIICSLLLLLLSPRTHAHRLNEYLQATRISLSKDSVGFQITLTPGSDIAQKILMEIDSNRDGLITAKEQESYVNSILRNITLTLDGEPARLRIISFNFPTVEAVKNGTGDVLLYVTAVFKPSTANHQLVFKTQPSSSTVYLVNCLQPFDTSIRIISQSRSNDQSFYNLNYTTLNSPPSNVLNQQDLIKKTDSHAVIVTYFYKGINHILTGYDHLLFICALVLGAAGLWDLIKVVTAFTIAHSITLTLAALGLAHLPAYIVEPLISASIVFIAVQNIFWSKHATGSSRLYVAFLFGLFHGLGFATSLITLMHAMPASLVFYAIVGFTLGIEAGNQMVLLPLYILLQRINHVKIKETRTKRLIIFQRFTSGVVAVAGLYYLYSAFATHI